MKTLKPFTVSYVRFISFGKRTRKYVHRFVTQQEAHQFCNTLHAGHGYMWYLHCNGHLCETSF